MLFSSNPEPPSQKYYILPDNVPFLPPNTHCFPQHPQNMVLWGKGCWKVSRNVALHDFPWFGVLLSQDASLWNTFFPIRNSPCSHQTSFLRRLLDCIKLRTPEISFFNDLCPFSPIFCNTFKLFVVLLQIWLLFTPCPKSHDYNSFQENSLHFCPSIQSQWNNTFEIFRSAFS